MGKGSSMIPGVGRVGMEHHAMQTDAWDTEMPLKNWDVVLALKTIEEIQIVIKLGTWQYQMSQAIFPRTNIFDIFNGI